MADPVPVLDELRSEHGPVVRLGAGPAAIVVVGSAAAVRDLFAEPVDAFRWNHRFNVLGFIVGSTSMIVSDGADHRRRRGAVQPALARRRLNSWIPMMVERSDAAIDAVIDRSASGETVEMYEVARRLVLDIVVRALFGGRLVGRVDEIGALFERPQAYLESPAFRQLPHPVPRTRRARVRADHRALDALIDEELAQIRAGGDGDEHLLADLVRHGELSDREIRDQTTSLLGAGYHTTAAAVAWTLWEMMQSDELWARLRAEADAAFEPPPGHDLPARLGLAQRTMRESLRLHPPGVMSPREVRRELVVGGHRVPRGTMVLWSAHLVGRDPEAWPEPLVFDPDRFVVPNGDRPVDRAELAAWVPFGGGARNCVGFALAQLELTIILARIAQRLDLDPGRRSVPAPVGMVVSRPRGGVPVRVRPR